MFFRPHPIIFSSLAVDPYDCADEDAEGGHVAESAPQYRPGHPERSGIYQLFETHFDCYVRVYEERFEARSGPLRPVVVRIGSIGCCFGFKSLHWSSNAHLSVPSLDCQ
jgi:hypothetical protein